jgi:hypothetical protein
MDTEYQKAVGEAMSKSFVMEALKNNERLVDRFLTHRPSVAKPKSLREYITEVHSREEPDPTLVAFSKTHRDKLNSTLTEGGVIIEKVEDVVSAVKMYKCHSCKHEGQLDTEELIREKRYKVVVGCSKCGNIIMNMRYI